MDSAAIGKRVLRIRSSLSWLKATLWAALFTTILFVIMNWRGCWFFRHGIAGLVSFLYVFVWMAIFFVLGPVWRTMLFGITLVAAMPIVGLHGIAEENSGPESAAVRGLQQIQDTLRDYNEKQGGTYPSAMPGVTLSGMARKFYRFQYLAIGSPDGRITRFLLQATPVRRDCDFHRSFTLTDDGKVFWTLEPRPATSADRRLEE